jgi:hypothetical protein
MCLQKKNIKVVTRNKSYCVVILGKNMWTMWRPYKNFFKYGDFIIYTSCYLKGGKKKKRTSAGVQQSNSWWAICDPVTLNDPSDTFEYEKAYTSIAVRWQLNLASFTLGRGLQEDLRQLLFEKNNTSDKLLYLDRPTNKVT